jgi:serine protease Do
VLANGTVLPAEVFSRDPINDIAVLKIHGENSFPQISLGDSSRLELGETMVVIGNALGSFQNTVSVGVVSGLSRFLSAEDGGPHEIAHLRGLIQTDAAINPGNSGGPLVNVAGEAVGISVATVVGAQNLGFAIPINSAKRDLEDIQKFGRIRKPFLGVHYIVIDKELKEQLSLPVADGAYIVRKELSRDPAVLEGSPGEKAGLREKDIVTGFNGNPITAERTLQDWVESAHIGEKIILTYIRGGETKSAETILEERI